MRDELNEKEQAWFDTLEEKDKETMRNGYADLIIRSKGAARLTYKQFVVVCAKVAVKLHKYDGKKLPKRVEKAFDYVEKVGKEEK
jgi:hypothetical protein